MPTTLDEYRPYDAGAGANVTEAGWRSMMKYALGDGALRGVLNELTPYGDSSGRQVKVPTGDVWVQGHQGRNSSEKTLPMTTNGSGNPRKDLVVVRNDFVNNRIELDVLAGTPAGSPVVPSLTQSTSIWEIALAEIAVANGYTTVAAADVTPYYPWAAPYGATILADRQTLSGTAASITCSKIPQVGFRNLIVKWSLLQDTGGVVLVRFNGDSTAGNYQGQIVYNSAASTAAAANDPLAAGNAGIRLGFLGTGSTYHGVGQLVIPRYLQTQARSLAGQWGSPADAEVDLIEGSNSGTGTVKSITVVSAGLFRAGSELSVYAEQ